ncbi:MAG: hypothetical protein GY820_04750 [Gammaproteobacteria bacterium]|nr:hypothetical protein [Gammaproteobacteria bacterium]
MKFNRILLLLIMVLFLPRIASGNRLVIAPSHPGDFRCKIEITHEFMDVYFTGQASRYKNRLQWHEKAKGAIEYTWIVFFDHAYEISGTTYTGLEFSVLFSEPPINERSDVVNLRYFGYNSKLGIFDILPYDEEIFTVKIVEEDIVFTLKNREEVFYLFDSPPDSAHLWIINNRNAPRRCLTKKKIDE